MKNYAGTIVRQIRNYVGDHKIVLGLSGGIDSAVVAALCCEVVRPDNIIAVHLPYGLTDTQDHAMITELCESLGIDWHNINILPAVDAVISEARAACPMPSTGTIGNIKARQRMVIQYAIANSNNALVVGTGNKTEEYLGYCTKYGDHGVDFWPIGDLYKHEVVEMAKDLGIPESIISRPPSAGLWENQTDEGELGLTYTQLDAIVGAYIENDFGNALHTAIDLGISASDMARIFDMIKNSEHKRIATPVFKKE